MIAHSVIILQYDAMDKYDLFIYMIYSPDPPISSTNKTDHHDITEILLEVALNTLTLYVYFMTIYKDMCTLF